MKRYGWKPEKPDFRDKQYSVIKPKMKVTALPPYVNLKEHMPPIFDQGELGSCTAQSISAVLNFTRAKQKETPEFIPSRLFIYYNERAAEGTINEDAGAEIRTGIKAVSKLGFCDESIWPYIPEKFKKRPSAAAYRNAHLYKAIEYFRLNNTNINELKTCLASGYPFVFGFTVYSQSIQEADVNGIIKLPSATDSMDGGHAVVCIGYDESKKLFIIQNSWGTNIGDMGVYYMPYDYISNPNLADDFWTIRKTEEKDNR